MTIFNPWVILSVLIAVLSSFGAGYYKGSDDEKAEQQAEIALLNQKSRETEQRLIQDAFDATMKLKKAQANAQSLSKKRNADIDSGALKLRIPVQAADCPTLSATADPTSPTGDSIQTTAELDREVAKSIVAITDQGDANTRQLNACIDAYNDVYKTLKGQK
jgi:hypothetical protein